MEERVKEKSKCWGFERLGGPEKERKKDKVDLWLSIRGLDVVDMLGSQKVLKTSKNVSRRQGKLLCLLHVRTSQNIVLGGQGTPRWNTRHQGQGELSVGSSQEDHAWRSMQPRACEEGLWPRLARLAMWHGLVRRLWERSQVARHFGSLSQAFKADGWVEDMPCLIQEHLVTRPKAMTWSRPTSFSF